MVKLDIGCGYLFDHKKHEDCIGIDLHHGTCDIICDVRFLPFKSDIFDVVYAYKVLEHIPLPLSPVLHEIERIMKKYAILHITIPIRHFQPFDYLIKFIIDFPFRTILTIKRLLRFKRMNKNLGWRHFNLVNPQFIYKFFIIIKKTKIFPLHYFFYGKKARFLSKIGFPLLYSPIPDLFYLKCIINIP